MFIVLKKINILIAVLAIAVIAITYIIWNSVSIPTTATAEEKVFIVIDAGHGE